MRHVLSAEQFTPEYLEILFGHAEELHAKSIASRESRTTLLGLQAGMILATLFYEPSTRTRMSFESAGHRLGMQVIGTENAEAFSSAAKGETLEDSARVIGGFADIIVLRHKENGAAARAAEVSPVPVINAGDGTGEHPTQSLLDMYTISREIGRLTNLNVAIMGDLKHGRTARSLTKLLTQYSGNHLTFVAPEGMGEDIKQYCTNKGTNFAETDSMYDALKKADVVYQTRVQRERHDGAHTGREQHPDFIIDVKALKILPERSVVMHPLPRVNEIDPAVDYDPRAAYFRQSDNGVFVRMALLDQLAVANTVQ